MIYTSVLNAKKKSDLLCAASIIKSGGVVVLPTDTVYGIVADLFSADAVDMVYRVKCRPRSKPFIVLVNSFDQFFELSSNLSPGVADLVRSFWPGPLTLVVKKSAVVPDFATSNCDTVGIRYASCKLVNTVIDLVGSPLVAPSANLSGSPVCRTFGQVFSEMNGRVNAILYDSSSKSAGSASTILSLVDENNPRILREGSIKESDIAKILGRCCI